MLKPMFVLAVCSSVALQGFAQIDIDFHRRFQLLESERLFDSDQYAEARALFQSLAEGTADPAEQSALLARAAIALGHEEGQFDAALGEAARLKHPESAQYARMSLMAVQSDWEGIVAQFGDLPMLEWPTVRLPARPRGAPEELRTLAFLKRAEAFERTGDFVRAERDLAAAADLVESTHMRARPSKLSVLGDLAALRARRLDDAQGAFEANKRISALRGGGARYYGAVLSAAVYLRDHARYDEAVEMVESMNPRGLRGGWFARGMQALGESLALAGRTDAAVDTFREVAEHPATAEAARGAAYLAWAGTLAEAGQTTAAVEVYRAMLARDDLRAAHREAGEAAIRELDGNG